MGDVRIPDLNEVTVAGRLGRDPELRYTTSGMPYCKFSVCHTRKFKKGDDWKEETCWLDVTCWKELAERVGAKIKKGEPVLVQGTLRQEKWTDKDGHERSKIAVLGTRVQPLEWPDKDGQGSQQRGGQARPASAPGDAGDDVPEEDIPF